MKLSKAIFDHICQTFDFRLLPAGETIFHEGDWGEELYVVASGQLIVSLRQAVLDQMTTGDLFGEMSLVSGSPRSGSVKAVTDCKLIPINKSQFTALIKEYPDFVTQIMSIMSMRLNRWMEAEVEHQRLEQELAIGRQIQLSLLPAQPPPHPGWQFASFYQAAHQVGGDFFDFINFFDEPHCQNIVIADVSGKGVPAALYMAVARTMIRAESRNGRSPAAVLARTNELIHNDKTTPLFLSALYANLNTATGKLLFAGAGHETPLLLRAASGLIEEFAPGGLLLGAFKTASFKEQQTTINEGDVILFYTDGISESRDEKGDFFGEERLKSHLQEFYHLSAAEIANKLVESLALFAGSAPQADDLTVLIIKKSQTGE